MGRLFTIPVTSAIRVTSSSCISWEHPIFNSIASNTFGLYWFGVPRHLGSATHGEDWTSICNLALLWTCGSTFGPSPRVRPLTAVRRWQNWRPSSPILRYEWHGYLNRSGSSQSMLLFAFFPIRRSCCRISLPSRVTGDASFSGLYTELIVERTPLLLQQWNVVGEVILLNVPMDPKRSLCW